MHSCGNCVSPYHERKPMQVVSFAFGEKKDGKGITHYVNDSLFNYTKCGLHFDDTITRWEFNAANFDSISKAICHHVTCGNCLRGYR